MFSYIFKAKKGQRMGNVDKVERIPKDVETLELIYRILDQHDKILSVNNELLRVLTAPQYFICTDKTE